MTPKFLHSKAYTGKSCTEDPNPSLPRTSQTVLDPVGCRREVRTRSTVPGVPSHCLGQPGDPASLWVGRGGGGGGGWVGFWLGIFGVEGLIEGFGLYWDYKLREGLRLLLDFAYGFGVEAVVRFYVTRQRCCMYARPAH